MQLITEERKQLVREILAQLSEKDRDLLRLTFMGEMDKAELCRRFGVNGSYLRVLLHRARMHFRNALMRTVNEQKRGSLGKRPQRARHRPHRVWAGRHVSGAARA